MATATETATTTLADIHPHIIQTHILPRLDGPSLSTTATTSSYLQNLCSDQNLWSNVSKSTWPSITDPRLDHIISTFPAGHRSFFKDSFPALITHVDAHRDCRRTWSIPQPDCSTCRLDRSSDSCGSDLISAVDIRYQNDIIFSRVEFTDTTPDFLSSGLRIELSDDPNSRSAPGVSRSIELEVDELAGADQATLSHLKESLTLNWILIDPTRKRAGNVSSIKAVSARQDWMSNETLIRYVTVLPGGETGEMVQCRIEVLLSVGKGGVGLNVKEVSLKLQDLDGRCLTGSEFMAVMRGGVMEENKSVRRKVVVDEEERWRSYREFKQIKKEKKEWVKKEEEKKDFEIKLNYFAIFISFFFSLYFLILML